MTITQIRLKRLARLGGPSVSASRQQDDVVVTPSIPPSSSPPRAPASAASRLLATTNPASPSSTSSSSSTSYSKPVEIRKPLSPVAGKPLANGASSMPSLVLGKRPSSTATTSLPKVEAIGPKVLSAVRQQPVQPRLKYDEWEAETVGTIFSVTLSVSSSLCEVGRHL